MFCRSFVPNKDNRINRFTKNVFKIEHLIFKFKNKNQIFLPPHFYTRYNILNITTNILLYFWFVLTIITRELSVISYLVISLYGIVNTRIEYNLLCSVFYSNQLLKCKF